MAAPGGDAREAARGDRGGVERARLAAEHHRAAGRGHPDLLAELCAFVAQGALALAPLCRLVDDPAAARATSPDDERVAILRTGGG